MLRSREERKQKEAEERELQEKLKELSRKYRTVLLSGEGTAVLVDILDILHWPNLTENPTEADVILAGAAGRILERLSVLTVNTLEDVVKALSIVRDGTDDVIPTVKAEEI